MQSMNAEVERTIIQFYPRRALVSPLDDANVSWSWDVDNRELKATVAALKALDPDMRPGTRGSYDVSEELILFGDVRVQLCYLAPFAAIDHQIRRGPDAEYRQQKRRIEQVLDAHGYELLLDRELEQHVPWIQPAGATVWECLFVPPTH